MQTNGARATKMVSARMELCVLPTRLPTAVLVTMDIGCTTANAGLTPTAISKAKSKVWPRVPWLMLRVVMKNFAAVSLEKVSEAQIVELTTRATASRVCLGMFYGLANAFRRHG